MFRRLSSTAITVTITLTTTLIATLAAAPTSAIGLAPPPTSITDADPVPNKTPAPDDGEQPEDTQSTSSTVDWGPNVDGWNVTVTNSTMTDLEFVNKHSWAVYTAPSTIDRRETTDQIRGDQSGLGGPADTQVIFRPEGEPESEHRYVKVFSKKSGEVNVECGAGTYGWYGSNPENPDKQCTVKNDSANEPVEVEFV